jgi:hypothetical protein
MGPAIEPNMEPGFSVIQWKAAPDPDIRTAIFLQGCPQKPTVDAILNITNALLEGKLKPAHTAIWVATATPTIVP